MALDQQAPDSKQPETMIDKVKQMVGVTNTEPAEIAAPIIKFSRVHIIVNPASGQEGLRLPALNKLLNDLEIDWEMFVIRRGGEARERAKQAIKAKVDAIMVYGGDGTVLEVASSMAGSDIPLVI